MNFKSDQKGFIFTLDATLALLIATMVLAGVAQIGSSRTQEQFTSLRMEREANDALRVLVLNGTTDRALNMMKEGKDKNKIRKVFRENLNEIFSDEIKFRLSIGENQIVVYPGSNVTYWDNVYENVKNQAVSSQLASVSPDENYFRALAWTPENREQRFVDNMLERRPYWNIKKITNRSEQSKFRDEIKKKKNNEEYEHYDAVFIPDADIPFETATIDELQSFAENGRLVVGGSTLYQNQNSISSNSTNDFTETFGIYNKDDDPDNPGGSGDDILRWDRDYLRNEIEDDVDDEDGRFDGFFMVVCPTRNAISRYENPLIKNFTPIQRIDYEGDNVYTFDDFKDATTVSNPRFSIEKHDPDQSDIDWDINTAKVLTQWSHYVSEDQAPDLAGLITNDTSPGTEEGDAVFIGANFVQNVIDENVSSDLWYKLVMNSISGSGGYEFFNRPIRLSLWI
ncbi:hypothetical protein AKJ52_01890 [candidate division MSBL1 archaeon SCGC-AAA382C18]|uniref:Uncharacterized protein n=1 Tax=candidate division MSBL1 archaeon SCGC-AAA382C18 TaxID=1698281 RepID=A0A133VJL5_9EURY|nr:hypothetical protein AKJ52_01890 [candidate division MSBL1 archaeon SCGC-AAA382C18]